MTRTRVDDGDRRRRRRVAAALLAMLLVVGLAGCASHDSRAASTMPLPAPSTTELPWSGGVRSDPSSSDAGTRTSRDAASTAATSAGRPASRKRGARPVVVLDPGHNGGNADHTEIISQQVDAGFGLVKDCNTVGASTDAGYPEHAFTFDVALRVRQLLVKHAVTVLLTRPNDTGVGPCVDQRARFGNTAGATAVVSIHGDGAVASGSGFHVIEAPRMAGGAATQTESNRLALAVRSQLHAHSGLGYATYLAAGTGLDHRTDLAGLNLSTRPAVLVECGNMRNPHDAVKMTTPAGRQRIAAAIAAAILTFLPPS